MTHETPFELVEKARVLLETAQDQIDGDRHVLSLRNWSRLEKVHAELKLLCEAWTA